MSEPIVLGIESTCDETAAAIVQGRTLRSNVVASSMEEHARYGGVIPEIASRAHAEAFVPCVSQALSDAGLELGDVDAIAVSAGPGLAGCLAVGVSGAKALAWAANKPLYGINHVIGHIAVTQLQFGPFPKDTLALIVSGGHTSLLHVRDVARHVDVVGTTLDDAAGECFDKVARLLGFPYPGGPHIDRHGQNGDPHAIKVPMGLTQGKAGAAHPYDFSFSGVKTAVARWVESEQAAGHEIPVDDVCASLADSVATVLARKAIETYGRIDVWVNNAGIMPLSLLSEDKVEDWDKCVDVNLKGVLYGIHACLGIMRAQKNGHIVNIGSLSSHQTGLTCGVYAATKFGVRAISETLREEEAAAGSGIRVTMLAPGMIATELPQSLTTQEGRDGMQAAYDALAIPAESVAQSVAFAVNMPENTAINEIIIRPTAQRL